MYWKSRSWILIGVLLAAFTAAHAQIVTTQVADTIYHADGTPATGTALISWPAFTAANGAAIPSGSTSAAIAAGGALSVQLIPNAGATPIGTYYTVVYHLDDGTVSRQYWVVPVSSAPVKISAIESTVLPTSVAMQTVSKAYVDTAIAAAVAHPQDNSAYVMKSGDTMTGPLNLPADPVSATQAADKNYVDESVAALASGLGQKVSTLPSAMQVVAQPPGTDLEVNRLNSVEYASQYVTGNGNNGIANATASPDCANGCDVRAEHSYSNETYSTASLNNQTHIQDARGGRQVDSYLNPLDVVHHGLSTAQAIDAVSTQSEASIFQQAPNAVPGSIGLAISQEGLAGGSNLFPEQIENPPYFKMGYSALSVTGTYNTQGQHVLVPESTYCFGVGDCLMGSRYLYASGGFRDSADEGAHPFDLQTHEDSRVFAGTCAGGCTAGSTAVTVSATSGGGTQGDGRFLIDMNPAKVISSGAIVGGAAGTPHATAQFSGTAFPVSVFLSAGQAIPSQAANIAPGTVTFAIATTGVPAGYATSTVAISAHSGLACLADQTVGYDPDNYEMASYTVIDATHLQMTLNKPHQLLATIAIGGLCGYGLEQTVDTANGIRQLFPVIGSYSAAGLYYAGGSTPVVGIMNQTSGYLNVSAAIASATRANNVVTVTTSGNLSANFNGLTVTVAGIADSSYNGSFLVTTTGANTFTYAQTGANSSSTGGSVSILTGGFALYPMAEVLSVFDAAARSVDGQMTLAPNNVAWAAGDPVEQPHFYQELVEADTEYVGQSVPRPATVSTPACSISRTTARGSPAGPSPTPRPHPTTSATAAPTASPRPPTRAPASGRRTMSLAAGERSAFSIHCNLHGCGNWNSGYNLFELDSSAGTDMVTYSPSASSLAFNLRGTPYTFTPQAFTAGTINVGTLNASSIAGVPTLDANGRVQPSPATYGGVLGNDMSPYGLGPAIFNNGNQVASFWVDGNNAPYMILGGVTNPSWAQEQIQFKARRKLPSWRSLAGQRRRRAEQERGRLQRRHVFADDADQRQHHRGLRAGPARQAARRRGQRLRLAHDLHRRGFQHQLQRRRRVRSGLERRRGPHRGWRRAAQRLPRQLDARLRQRASGLGRLGPQLRGAERGPARQRNRHAHVEPQQRRHHHHRRHVCPHLRHHGHREQPGGHRRYRRIDRDESVQLPFDDRLGDPGQPRRGRSGCRPLPLFQPVQRRAEADVQLPRRRHRQRRHAGHVGAVAHLAAGHALRWRAAVALVPWSPGGTGGMVISAPGGTLAAGDVLTYTCVAYW